MTIIPVVLSNIYCRFSWFYYCGREAILLRPQTRLPRSTRHSRVFNLAIALGGTSGLTAPSMQVPRHLREDRNWDERAISHAVSVPRHGSGDGVPQKGSPVGLLSPKRGVGIPGKHERASVPDRSRARTAPSSRAVRHTPPPGRCSAIAPQAWSPSRSS